MGSTRLRRPPAPTDAERARSLALRGGEASLVGTGSAPVTPLVHHVRADGSAVLLLADDEPLLARVRGGETAVMLELVDRAAVDLREPVRGLLWITGWLWLPEQRAARRMALQVADVRPQERLLELGHGATLVRLDPGSAVLADGDGCAALTPVDIAAARPDPFCLMEDHWLAHLEAAHPEVFVGLAQHLPPALGRCRGRGSARWASTAAGCGCAWRPRSATTTCVWGSRAGPRRPRSCGSSSTGSWDGAVLHRPTAEGAVCAQ